MANINRILTEAVTNVVHFVGKLPIWVVAQLDGTKAKEAYEKSIAADEQTVITEVTSALKQTLVSLASNTALALTAAKTALGPIVSTVANSAADELGLTGAVKAQVVGYVTTAADTLIETAYTDVIDAVTGLATPTALAAVKNAA